MHRPSQITNLRPILIALDDASKAAFASAIRGSWLSVNSIHETVISPLWFLATVAIHALCLLMAA